MAIEEHSEAHASPASLVAAPVADAGAVYVEGGRRVPAGHGWDWIAAGWRLFRRQSGVWILLTLVFGLIFFALAVFPFLGQIAASILMPVFLAGVMIGCRKVEAGEELELADLFAGFRRHTGALMMVGVIGLALTIAVFIPVMLLSGAGAALTVLFGSAPQNAVTSVLVGMLVFLALVVPIYMALWYAPALVVFHGHTAQHALMQSFKGCLRNVGAFLLYGAILFVLALFASVPFGLGWLVLGPVGAASVYAGYRDIYASS